MAFAIEMNNRMKRKAAAMGVFLNVETQKKFLKMASNVELQNRNDTQRRVMDDRHTYYQIGMAKKNEELRRLNSECFQRPHQCLEQEVSYGHLQMLNDDLKEQNAHQKKVIEKLTETSDKQKKQVKKWTNKCYRPKKKFL